MSNVLTPERLTTEIPADLENGWQVIVINDEHHTFDEVIIAFCKVLPGMTPELALEKAMEIYTTGRSVVFRGMKEPCELYCEMLRDPYKLRADVDR